MIIIMIIIIIIVIIIIIIIIIIVIIIVIIIITAVATLAGRAVNPRGLECTKKEICDLENCLDYSLPYIPQ